MPDMRARSLHTLALLYRICEQYRLDGAVMPDVLEELTLETIAEILKKLPPEVLRKHLSPEERLKGLPPEERLKGLSVDELLAALPQEMREALARRLAGKGSPPSPE